MPCSQVPEDPGQVALHRLNRTEYDNTVRDLLGDTSRPAQAFPSDDSTGSGFDNDGHVLGLSPLLFEQYAAAAERLVEEAWAREETLAPEARRLRVCEPQGRAADACTRTLLTHFARRAWRRPVAPDEVAPLLALVDASRAAGEEAPGAVKVALRALLKAEHGLLDAEGGGGRVAADAHPASSRAGEVRGAGALGPRPRAGPAGRTGPPRGGHRGLPHLHLGNDGGGGVGNCDSGYSCAYTQAISWAGPSTPMPKETNPRAAFERVFAGAGSLGGATREEQLRRLRQNRSILDVVGEQARGLQRKLGATDRRKLEEYLTGVRELERRIEALEQGESRACVTGAPPADAPGDVRERTRAFLDLIVLAFSAT